MTTGTPGGARAGGARLRPAVIGCATMALAALLLAAPAAAQVGHDPESSPYRDIRRGHSLTFTGGYFGGDGGKFGIGPHDGPTYGFRYDIRTASPLQVGIGLSYADLQRIVVDPFVELVNRFSEPVKQSVWIPEAHFQLNLTGGKSWHRLAPYIAGAVGLTFGSGTPQDTSGYGLGHKVTLSPGGGFRLFVTSRVHLRGDARATFMKLSYPTTFQQEPVLEPGTPPDFSNAVITDNKLTEWTASWWLQVGIGYSFSP